MFFKSTHSVEKKWLIMPMEIVERELNGYFLLALEAAKRGWNCVIGTKKEIFAHYDLLPKGVVFLKSATTADIAITQTLKDGGHKPVSQDVEGLIYTSMEEFVTVRFHGDAVKNLEKIMFWGQVQKDALTKAFPDFSDRMVATGSPLTDMWHPDMCQFFQDQIDSIHSRFGKYILIPSSFGSVNHYMGRKGNEKLMKDGKYVKDEVSEEFYSFWDSYEDHLQKIFYAFLDILPDISATFPDHQIIIRPHPSESHQTWKDAARDLDNVTVIFEGVVAPWLLGADAILHWGCTTGLEGYLMGKPVVAYNPSTPEEDAKFEHKLPHSISIIGRTKEETVQALKNVVAEPDGVLKNHPHVLEGDKNLASWVMPKEGNKDAAYRIMDEVESLDVQRMGLVAFDRRNESVKEHILQGLGGLLSVLKPLRSVLPTRIWHAVETRAYGRHKTRNIDPAAFQESLKKMAEIRGVDGIESAQIHQNLFWVGRNNPE